MAITNTPLLGLPYAGADTDETYAVLGRLFVKDGQKLTLPEIVDMYTPTVGKVYINAADWTAADGTADEYDAKITISGVESNSMILLYPDTEHDAEKAKNLGIRAKAASGVANDDTFVIVRATGGDPTVTEGISLVYIALRGYAVWSAGITPPALPYATVIGVDPYIATEEGDRDDIAASQRLVTEVVTALRSSLSTLTTGLADTNKAVELRLKTADLPTKLDEYRSANGLIDKTVGDLVNYYTKSQTLTKDEINALVSAIPKFTIEVVTSLPTSNISDTTVYLVKSGDDDTNLYTEYIRTGGKWEKLGTQTVDLTGYATEAWVNDVLASYVKTVDMETYITGLLESYLTKDSADNTYQPIGDYLTPTTGDQRYPAKQTTEDKLTEHGNKITQLEEALANSMVEFAESVEWLEANGDKNRTYYLPDGYEYAYSNKYVEITHNANDGTGYLNNIAPNVPWGEPYNPDFHMTGFWTSPLVRIDPTEMAAVGNAAESRVTVSGVPKVVPAYNSRSVVVWYYKQDGTQYLMKAGTDLSSVGTNGEITTPFTFNLKDVNIFADSNWANVYGVRIGLGISSSDITKEDVKDLVVNIPFFDFAGYRDGWYSTGKLHSDDPAVQENANNIARLQERMTAAEETLEQIASGVSTEPLFPKLGLIGDSLTNQEYQGWQAITVSMLGNPVWHKNAITGSSVANYGDGRETDYTPFVDRYLNTPSDCDCIVIMGGTNDATYQYSYDMGTVGVLADNTFKGAYSTIIEGLLTRNPATRLMLMVPPRFYNVSDNSLNANISKYAEAVREIANHYALPCLDLFDLLGQNKCTAEWGAWDWANNDPIHFSNAIAPRVGRMVANFIRQYY